MNNVNGNKQVQIMPNMQPVYPAQTSEYPNYMSPMYHLGDQYVSAEIQQVLNNMYMALSNQTKLLSYLVEKNESNIETIAKIYQEMTSLKEIGGEVRKDEKEDTETTGRAHFKQSSLSSDITASDLVTILYGPKTQFKYKIIMDQ
jgi:hypothetical protein